MGSKPEVKTRSVDEKATWSWFFRPFWQKSMDRIIKDEAKKGFILISTTPVTNNRGRTVRYMLTFKKD